MVGSAMILGVAAGARSLDAVLVAGKRVVAQAHVDMTQAESYGAALRAALSALGRYSGFRGQTVFALGPSIVQVKPLPGLSSTADARVVGTIVSQNASRFFLSDGDEAVVAVVSAHDKVWGAACKTASYSEIVDACRACGLRPAAIIPSVVAIARACGPSTIWSDGACLFLIESKGGSLSRVTRLRAQTGELTPHADSLGPTDSEHIAPWLGAYYAARYPRRGAFVLESHHEQQTFLKNLSRRQVVAIAALVFAVILQPVANAGTMLMHYRSNNRDAVSMTDSDREAEANLKSLQSVTQSLSVISQFGSAGLEATSLLALLARILPEGVSLSSVSADSASVTLSAYGEGAIGIVAELESLRPRVHGEIVGPVSKAVVRGVETDRVTVRFRLPPGALPALPDTLGVAQR